MKKAVLFLIFSLLISIVLFGQNKLIMDAGDLPPHTSPVLDGHGMLAKILSESLKDKGWSIEYNFYPVARLIQMMSNGNIRGTFTAEAAIDKNDFYYVPLQINRLIFFYMKDKFPHGLSFTTLSDLSEYVVGTVRGTPSEAVLTAAGISIESAVDEVQNFKKLQSGRIDLVSTVDVFGLYQIKENGFNIDDFGMTNSYDESVSIFAILNSDPIAAKVIGDINDGFKAAKRNGRLLEILEGYLGKGNVPDYLIP